MRVPRKMATARQFTASQNQGEAMRTSTTGEPTKPHRTGMVISQFSSVDASGEAERLIACLEQSERLAAAVAIRARSYALLHAKPRDRVVESGAVLERPSMN